MKKKTLAKLQQPNFASILHSGLQRLLCISVSSKRSPARTCTQITPHSNTNHFCSVTRVLCAFGVFSERQLIFYLPANCFSKSRHRTQLQYFSLLLCLTLLSTGCASLSNQIAGKVQYANPPAVGTWLQPQRELVACETVIAARHMADFGFFHPQCKQLTEIGPQDYQVKSREIMQLNEGPMWLLQVENQERIYYVPIPWHDWI